MMTDKQTKEFLESDFTYKETTGYEVHTCTLPNGRNFRVERYPDDIFKYSIYDRKTMKDFRYIPEWLKRVTKLWLNIGNAYAGMTFTDFVAKMYRFANPRYANRKIKTEVQEEPSGDFI